VDLVNAPLILDRIDDTLRSHPDRTAVVDLSTDVPVILTYDELSHLSNRCAARLLEFGVKEGEAVAYQLPSSWEFVVLSLALWRISAIPCPILPSLREREVKFIVESSGSRVLIVPDVFRKFSYSAASQVLKRDVDALQHVFIVDWQSRNSHSQTLGGLLSDKPLSSQELSLFRPQPSTYAQLLYTSGTTGEPKGVLHTHQTLASGLLAHIDTLSLSPADKVWVPSPLAHQTGFLYGMMLSLCIGTSAIVQAIWNVDGARKAIQDYGATFVQAAMPFLADLTKSADPPQGLRLFIATGAAIPRPLAHVARTVLDCNVVGAWGSTESCLVTVGHPDDAPDNLWGTDGQVIGGMAMRVVDDAGRVLPPGKEGNFQVKTPAMFVSYLHHPEWYNESFTPDGFFDTGDLARIDENGYMRMTGRKKDVINRGGEKIPVVELEDILYQNEALADAALVAMPDARLGERACLYAVVKPQYTAAGSLPSLEDICTFLQQRGVAKIYWPERLEVIPEMPRTASGKIQKVRLREDIREKLQQEELMAERK